MLIWKLDDLDFKQSAYYQNYLFDTCCQEQYDFFRRIENGRSELICDGLKIFCNGCWFNMISDHQIKISKILSLVLGLEIVRKVLYDAFIRVNKPFWVANPTKRRRQMRWLIFILIFLFIRKNKGNIFLMIDQKKVKEWNKKDIQI